MTIFAVLMPTPQPALKAEIEKHSFLALNDLQYLVSFEGTVTELSADLGVTHPERPRSGNAVILATTSYYGRAPSSVWDWMKARLEAAPRA